MIDCFLFPLIVEEGGQRDMLDRPFIALLTWPRLMPLIQISSYINWQYNFVSNHTNPTYINWQYN